MLLRLPCARSPLTMHTMEGLEAVDTESLTLKIVDATKVSKVPKVHSLFRVLRTVYMCYLDRQALINRGHPNGKSAYRWR